MDSVVPPPVDSILEAVGMTPIVRLKRVGAEYPVEIFAKCEFVNPGGSIKDRIAIRMIREAEKRGDIKPGDTLIEPTSGNTGIGLAMATAVLGYKLIIVMPMKMSMEKQLAMEALGAQIIRTPMGFSSDHPNSNFSVARRLQAKIPNSHILDQFANCDNPQAHYETTAVEILEQMGGKFDYFVAGAGTGGTLTGCARRFRDAGVGAKIIGVDPVGSLIGGGDLNAPYQVEGIGYDFVPKVLDQSLVDEYIKVDDEPAFLMARRLMAEEGFLCGGSCGSAMAGAMEISKRCKGGERIVVVLPDNVRNYMSKFVNNEWMKDHGFNAPPAPQHVDWEAFQRDDQF